MKGDGFLGVLGRDVNQDPVRGEVSDGLPEGGASDAVDAQVEVAVELLDDLAGAEAAQEAVASRTRALPSAAARSTTPATSQPVIDPSGSCGRRITSPGLSEKRADSNNGLVGKRNRVVDSGQRDVRGSGCRGQGKHRPDPNHRRGRGPGSAQPPASTTHPATPTGPADLGRRARGPGHERQDVVERATEIAADPDTTDVVFDLRTWCPWRRERSVFSRRAAAAFTG